MIEEAIAKLTAAVEANTVALNAILASAGNTPAPTSAVEEPKPAKKKAVVEVKTKAEIAEKAVDEAERAAAVEAAEAEEPKHTILEAIEASKRFIAADRETNKPRLAALREKYQIETVKDLAPDQVDAFMADLAKL